MDRQIVLKIACGLLALFIAWSQRSLGDDGPQRLGPQRDPSLPDLSKGWKFKIGDDATWSVPSLDDSSWQPIDVGKPWENQGHVGYDGYAWYRIHFRVPEKLQNQPEVEKYQSLRLALGKIDDVDQTWLNDKLIGSTGNFSDPYEAALVTLSYFDTLNLADRIQCPVLLGLGLQDAVCPAATICSVYNRLPGAREYDVYPHDEHSVGVSHFQKQQAWIRKHFLIEPEVQPQELPSPPMISAARIELTDYLQ